MRGLMGRRGMRATLQGACPHAGAMIGSSSVVGFILGPIGIG